MRKHSTHFKKIFTPKLAILAVAAVGLIYISNYRQSGTPTSLSPSASISEQKAYWSSQITSLGASQAYQLFKDQYKSVGPNTDHPKAHLFGEVLYKKTGPGGITVCDAEFAFGCYHSFFIAAISDRGQEIVLDLDQACLAKFGPLGTGCQHGIGHGLMEYLGGSKLAEALSQCFTFQKLTLLGCTSGVFMEYNFPTITDSESVSTSMRELDQKHPYAPCQDVEAKFQKSCFFELPQWWYQKYDQNSKVMGELCQKLESTPRDYCFRGLGNTLGARVSYDLEEGLAKCGLMPTNYGTTYCRAGLSWSFFAEPTKRTTSKLPCQSLTEADQNICLEKSDLTKEVF
ncbi:MAG TPA: hypothetical protein VFK94_03465 [Patescibacteria group bacterium]|nr:hypothetical protein [Patescibacteria group bacterium]